jgi:hypothetical protein
VSQELKGTPLRHELRTAVGTNLIEVNFKAVQDKTLMSEFPAQEQRGYGQALEFSHFQITLDISISHVA